MKKLSDYWNDKEYKKRKGTLKPQGKFGFNQKEQSNSMENNKKETANLSNSVLVLQKNTLNMSLEQEFNKTMRKALQRLTGIYKDFTRFANTEHRKLSNPVFALGFSQIKAYYNHVLDLINDSQQENDFDLLIDSLSAISEYLFIITEKDDTEPMLFVDFLDELTKQILSNPNLPLVKEKMKNKADIIWLNLLICSPKLMRRYYHNFNKWHVSKNGILDYINSITEDVHSECEIATLLQISLLQSVILLPDVINNGRDSLGRFLFLRKFNPIGDDGALQLENNYVITCLVWLEQVKGYLGNIWCNGWTQLVKKAICIYSLDWTFFNIMSLYFKRDCIYTYTTPFIDYSDISGNDNATYWASLEHYVDAFGSPILPCRIFPLYTYSVDHLIRDVKRNRPPRKFKSKEKIKLELAEYDQKRKREQLELEEFQKKRNSDRLELEAKRNSERLELEAEIKLDLSNLTAKYKLERANLKPKTKPALANLKQLAKQERKNLKKQLALLKMHSSVS